MTQIHNNMSLALLLPSHPARRTPRYYEKHGEPLFSSHMIDLSEEPIGENIEVCKGYLERMSKIGPESLGQTAWWASCHNEARLIPASFVPAEKR